MVVLARYKVVNCTKCGGGTPPNEVALRFNGMISDEGIEDKWRGEENYCLTYQEYAQKMVAHVPNKQMQTALLQEDQRFAPSAFRVDLGPEIQLQMDVPG